MQLDLLNQLRAQVPLVVNYANYVTPNFVANGLNALGASPIMTSEVDEADDLVKITNTVVINLGTINHYETDLVWQLCTSAVKYHKPIVLDPVAVGATAYRLDIAQKLLQDFPIAVIRGNVGEIAALAQVDWATKGIDAGTGDADPAAIAKACATRYHNVVALSGITDYITDGQQLFKVGNQTPLLPLTVGSGDLLSSIIGAFVGITDNYYEAAQVGCAVLACTGEIAAQPLHSHEGGTFAARLLDKLTIVDKEDILEILK
ncbi:hydroxyethylthiazole kinase [Agrilactobacillus composti DSM 18527 = JCM 14202]|uniref:Hydroxyethylthiazole kinase n=1 Tax=Agrilactobacillus composti DSM 18527 = JCM 14202 TaxID=1423734 RepID=X0QHY4_9LACO|nr:hydroxyethylthiazole kinase [Agrilactobacillus composti]KRM30679.1 hydroxyethylthiazole kinase [Agrilactobacillus composti DSM 18527 = JCM 14202]GAF38225.1 hydroxyethylthiazole kinase [Agrilactobacillus composti DSM 18527 = JCM 14202]